MPCSHNPEGLFIWPDLPGDRKIQVFKLRSARLHICKFTLQNHHSFVPDNQQIHLAMPWAIEIGELKPLPVFRARDRRRQGLFISQPRRFRALRATFRNGGRPQAHCCVMQSNNRSKAHAAPLGFLGKSSFRFSIHNKISPFLASSTNSAFGVSFWE